MAFAMSWSILLDISLWIGQYLKVYGLYYWILHFASVRICNDLVHINEYCPLDQFMFAMVCSI